jgi:type II secretory pathway component PulF
MIVWRYIAVPVAPAGGTDRRTGELTADSAAEVRSSLRRIGLQVVDLRRVRGPRRRAADGAGLGGAVRDAIRDRIDAHLRTRRRDRRAEVFDGLATMIASGLPLPEAVDTLVGSIRQRRAPLRWMLMQLRERLRAGDSIGDAMAAHPAWFDASEVAMVRAGHHSGTLPAVLQSLSERHERSSALGHKLTAALAYPAILCLVGLGVVIFLSVKTLPDLVQVLTDAGIAAPTLTMKVMALGQMLAAHGLTAAAALAVLTAIGLLAVGVAARRGAVPPRWLGSLAPTVLRRLAVARLAFQLSRMLRSGVPMVEALRVLAPTAGGPLLRRRVMQAADRVERGDELSAALDDDRFFDAEFRRLLDIGQASGELDALLDRLARRYARQANRLIDRMTTLLEPAVILALAVLVGFVVMAAVLPLIRLQEVF